MRLIRYAEPHIYAPVDDSLVLWISGSGRGVGSKVFDLSGKGNHGTIYGACWKNTPVGHSTLSFDGVDDYVDCGNDESLNITDEITIEAWIKPEEDKNCYVLGKTDYTSPGGYSLYWRGLDNTIRLFYGSSKGVSSDAVFTDLNTFVHAVIVVDRSGNVYFYRNAKSAGTAGPISLESCNFHLIIGNRDGTKISANDFHGFITEARIYNRALSAEEIRERYNITKHLYGY